MRHIRARMLTTEKPRGMYTSTGISRVSSYVKEARSAVWKLANHLEVDNTQRWIVRKVVESWPADGNDIEVSDSDGLRDRERLPDVVTSGAGECLSKVRRGNGVFFKRVKTGRYTRQSSAVWLESRKSPLRIILTVCNRRRVYNRGACEPWKPHAATR